MASLAHTTSSPKPQTEDRHFDMTRAGADQSTSQQRWVGGLPPEIWLCILDQLCPHCRPGPVLKPGVEFTERTQGSMMPRPLPPRSRRDLLSMTMTCSVLRDLAQSYVFHCFDKPSEQSFSYFRRTVVRQPDLARGVRDMAVSSDLLHRCILTHLGNIRTLNFGIQRFHLAAHWKNKSANKSLVDGLKELRSLRLMPIMMSDQRIVNIPNGRLWLENLMEAAPKLRELCCYRFTDFTYSQSGQGMKFPAATASPNYAGLPKNKITSLNLLQTWFRFHSLKKLLGNFKDLREFKLLRINEAIESVIHNEKVRPVDGHDVVTLLEPLRHQLEVLELDFSGYPESLGFRSILSLSAFTTLKRIRLCNMSFNTLPRLDEESLVNMTLEDFEKDFAARLEKRKYLLANLLPCKSLEFLQLDDFGDWFEPAVVELARRASRGEFPNLKHVRLHGGVLLRLGALRPLWNNTDFVQDLARYHDLKSMVPETYWNEAQVERAMYEPELQCEAQRLFLAAGVLFERLNVLWPVPADNDAGSNNGWMRVYPTACAGDCGNPDCVVVKSTP